jgi:hypothetical protein
MTTAKDKAKADDAPKAEDHGQEEVQEKVDHIEDTGVLGEKVDPRPDSDYSLKSGPDSPPAAADIHTRAEQIGTIKKENG